MRPLLFHVPAHDNENTSALANQGTVDTSAFMSAHRFIVAFPLAVISTGFSWQKTALSFGNSRFSGLNETNHTHNRLDPI